MPTAMDPDRLAALEEERRFLLRSLADLERERDAGDVDEVDYHELRDGYTVRAAATLRAIEAGRAALPERPAPDWRRRVLGAIAVVAAVAVVWWALAASSAQRLPGQQLTGLDPRGDRAVLMSQARAIQFQDPAAAAELYAQVLELDPLDVEALTYRGWTLALSTSAESDSGVVVERLREAVDDLALAIDTEPDYPDPYCFLGIVQARFLRQAAAALPYLDSCLAGNPPADVTGLVQGLRDEVAASVEAGPSDTTVPDATVQVDGPTVTTEPG